MSHQPALLPFLQPGQIIDSNHPAIRQKAVKLARGLHVDMDQDQAIAAACFQFVRDEISHSGDARSEVVTCRASEVLEYGTGWCFAKSHLLAALLRANGIPAGLCYQRLVKDGPGSFTFHGLNAVWLREHGWYRCDPRGNKAGVSSAFTPPLEQLAWNASDTGEIDFSERFAEPIPAVLACLMNAGSYQQARDTLPDGEQLTW